ncbi:MAG: AAA family ATPase [Deltaproteobacteria bacterium]|nr:AAA family ATPase [Deltaproteobacteria bacterium]
MIQSISIHNVASFDPSGVQITDFKKVNFIYGANGSGKTTISNLVASPNSDDYKKCTISWQNGIPLKTLVYNKQFRDINFGRGKIEGVFTLGQATKADIERIKQKQEELVGLKAEGIKRRETQKKQEEKNTSLESMFKEEVWKKIYKIYEIHFKEAFKGLITKERFKQKLLLEYEANKSPLLAIDTL